MDLSSVVTSVLGQLANLALNKASELKSVREQVVAWQAELELIQGKLKDVEPKVNKTNTEEIWMNQLEVVANRIRNVIETFQKIEEDKSKGLSKIKFKIWKKPLQLNDLSTEIGSITQKLKMLKEYSPQPGIQLAITVAGTQVGTTASGTGTEDPAPIPLSSTNKPSDIDDPEVVGLDSDKHRILKHLLDESISRRTILSIVGVGGLGKTTLAKKVYNSSELGGLFRCRSWLSISQMFNENNILRKILYSIEPAMKSRNPPLEDEDLVTEVKGSLSGKKYLIILDDVWSKDLWDGLRKALPDSNNGSRVIITTRNVDVARSADRNTKEYNLHFLTDDESVALLFRTALQRHIQPEDYPPPLKDVAKRLIKKCGGLPLALVVLGGILSTEEDIFSAWNMVFETLDWHDQDGEKCMKVLATSYEALPNYLKQCFLYFASFPEDYEISAKHMTRMWVADELIPKPRAGTLEDQAEKYLQELVKRCLVQVTRKHANGYCKYCHVHDLLRDLAIHKAEEENFFTVFSEGDGGNQELPPNRVSLQFYTSTENAIYSTNTHLLPCLRGNMSSYEALQQKKELSNYPGFEQLRNEAMWRSEEVELFNALSIRDSGNQELPPTRVALQFYTSTDNDSYSTSENIRSLLCFRGNMSSYEALEQLRGLSNYQGFKQLRVLVFEGFRQSECDISSCKNWLEGLVHLRYLGFRDCHALPNELLGNISLLKSLETLDCNGTDITLNPSLWEISTLRHVVITYKYHFYFATIACPLNWNHLKNLQTIKWVCLGGIPRVGCNVNLRTLKISCPKVPTEGEWQQWQGLQALLSRTVHLSSLAIKRYIIPFSNVSTRGLPCHETIQSLHFDGRLHSMSFEMFPKNLTKLKLNDSKLNQDPMPILERLQSLRILHLLYRSYKGEKMICSAGGFPSLQKLQIRGLEWLSEWEIEKGAMPVLSRIEIDECRSLYIIPELQNVTNLQELIVHGTSCSRWLRELETDRHKIEHIPSVRITTD